jgi:hypothetical protein
MQSLQVFSLEAGVTSRHFERRMAECLLKMGDAPASPDIVQRERMPAMPHSA